MAGFRSGTAQECSPKIIEDYITATEALDLEQTLALYADSIIWEDPGYGDEGDYFDSKAEVRAMYRWLYSLPDIQIDDTSAFTSSDGCKGAIEWLWSGLKNHESYVIRGVTLLEIQGDKIVREIIYYDPTTAP